MSAGDGLGAFVSRLRVAVRPRSRIRIRELVPHGPRETRPTGFGSEDNTPLVGGDLHSSFDAHTGHVAHKWRHYFDVYETLLAPFRAGFGVGGVPRPLRFLEIGVSEGGSLEFWRDWLGPEAVIVGVDVDQSCRDVVSEDVALVRIGSQDDPRFLRSVVDELGGSVDVVLDDGSHIATHQRVSFNTLWPLLTDGGLYICEDVHTSYWPGYEGGLRRPGTAVEEAKDLVDDMHRRYYTEARSRRPAIPSRPDVWSVSFFDSVIAVHKRSRPDSRRIVRGDETRREQQSDSRS